MSRIGKTIALMLVVLFIMYLVFLPSTTVKAQSKTITVTNVSQLMNAIYGATTGSTISVKNGTYDYPEGQTLVISKSLSIIGDGANSTTLNFSPRLMQSLYDIPYYESAINIQGSDVTFSGFTINSIGGSVSASGNRVQITKNVINTCMVTGGRYQNVSMNTLTGGIQCYGIHNNIERNTIIGHGIWEAGENSIIHENDIQNCNSFTEGVGIMLQGSGAIVFSNSIRNCSHAITVFGP